jgi:mannose-6-phosphate isomerase-like protein (cupin superfamily)
MQSINSISGYVSGPGESERIEWPGHEFVVKASREQTAGGFSLIEIASQSGVSRHIHGDKHEAFYVLEGEYTVHCGDQTFTVGPGGFAFVPRGTPHELKLAPGGGRCLVLFAPGGYEGYWRELEPYVRAGAIPAELREETRIKYGLIDEPDPDGSGFTVASGEGQQLAWPGVDIRVKASGDQTGRRFSVLEDRSDETTVPLHVHEREDEAFYLLDGNMSVNCGDDTFQVGPGSFVFLPRGIPHGHTIDPGGATKLILLCPGGFEGFFRDMAQGFAASMTFEKRDATSAKYGVTFLES